MNTIKISGYLFILLILIFHPGCNKNTLNRQRDSGIEGQVVLGPMSAVVSSDNPRPDKPYKATLKILNQEREQVLQVDTDEEGKFKITLEPGEYIISPIAPNPLRPPYPEEQKVTVKSNDFTTVIVRFDTGIR